METNPLIYADPAVAAGENPVLFVWRSPENKLFLLGKNPIEQPDELLTNIDLSRLIGQDPSLKEATEIPAGFRAYRKTAQNSWKIAQLNPKTGQGQYMDGYLEWINKMYVDGYFTGGTVPHFYTFPGRPKLYGWISASLGLALLVVVFIVGRINRGEGSVNSLGPAIIGLFLLFIGVSLLLRTTKRKSAKDKNQGR